MVRMINAKNVLFVVVLFSSLALSHASVFSCYEPGIQNKTCILKVNAKHDLIALPGKKITSQEVQDFLSTLGTKYEENSGKYPHWMYFGSGVEMVIDPEKKTVHAIFLFGEQTQGYQIFKGSLPAGLNWHNTREEVEAILGNGNRRSFGSEVTMQYPDRHIEIQYQTEDESNMNAKMSTLQIRTF